MRSHTRRSLLSRVAIILLGLGFDTAMAQDAAQPQTRDETQHQLIMVAQTGCAYCARWDAEISPIYPKTPEGAFAPLRRIDLHDPRPTDIIFNSPLAITPTFVLVKNGQEHARIEGYGGDEMFWAMLTVTLRDHSTFTLQAIE